MSETTNSESRSNEGEQPNSSSTRQPRRGRQSGRRNFRRGAGTIAVATLVTAPAGADAVLDAGLSDGEGIRRLRHPGLRIERKNRRGEVIGTIKKPRRHREKRVLAVLEGIARDENPSADDETIAVLVQEAYDHDFGTDPAVAKEYLKLSPSVVAPRRGDIYTCVEVHSIRQMDEMRELEACLSVLPNQPGPKPKRKLPIATFERNFLEWGRSDIFHASEDLFRVKNDPVGWSYDWPARELMHVANIFRQQQAMLDFRNPGICLRLNVQSFLKLRAEVGDEDMGRYLAIDGTDIPVSLDQHSAIHPNEELLIRGSFEDAQFGSHGATKWWRGYLLVTIIDLKSTLPIGFALLRSVEPEWSCLDRLLKQIGELWEEFSGEPWQPEYITGDAHFNTEAVNRLLEEQFGIHPVFPDPHNHDSTMPFADTSGVPCCAEHGEMKLVQSEGFLGPRERAEEGLRFGQAADLSGAVTRWKCTGTVTDENGREQSCPVTARTHWNAKPRLYPYLPYGGIHKDRIARRKALQIRRNACESINARLKSRGVGTSKMNVVRWLSSRQQVEWLAYCTLLSMTLQQLAFTTGLYDASLAEAESYDLIGPSLPTQAQEIALLARNPNARVRQHDDEDDEELLAA